MNDDRSMQMPQIEEKDLTSISTVEIPTWPVLASEEIGNGMHF